MDEKEVRGRDNSNSKLEGISMHTHTYKWVYILYICLDKVYIHFIRTTFKVYEL